MNVTMVTSWLRTLTNRNMVEIGRPPSSSFFYILPGSLSQQLLSGSGGGGIETIWHGGHDLQNF